MRGGRSCHAREGARHPGLVSDERWKKGCTNLFPSEFCHIFEVDATCETNRAISCIVEDEGE